jgi:hypothetical protein
MDAMTLAREAQQVVEDRIRVCREPIRLSLRPAGRSGPSSKHKHSEWIARTPRAVRSAVRSVTSWLL